MSTIQEQIAQARAAGYSDDDIALKIGQMPAYTEKMAKALDSGYGASEIVNRLAGKPAPEKAKAAPDAPRGSEGKQQGERMAALAKDAYDSRREKVSLGLLETAASAVTGLASSTAGGLAGLARTAYNLAAGESLDKATELGAKTLHGVQEAATYQPRTSIGKLGNEVLSAPFNAAKDIAGTVGGKVGEGYGMIADLAENGGIDGRDVNQGAGARRGRIAGEELGRVAVDVGAIEASRRQAMQVANKAGMRVKEPEPGKDFTPLRDLTPEDRIRMQRQTDLGQKPTLSSVTRDPEQFRFEDQIGKTTDGSALRTRELDNNAAMIKAIEDTDTMRAGRRMTENTREAGRSIASAIQKSDAEAGALVDTLYQKARDAGETKQVVSVKPLEQYLYEQRFEQTTVPALKTMADKLAFLKEESKGKVTIDTLENLYKSANKLAKVDDSAAMFMGDVKRVINEITDGAGGDLYRAARAARLEQALEFSDRSAIANLIEKKNGSRTDYKTSAEQVFDKAVVNSSLVELQDVVQSLLTDHPQAGRAPKLQAFRELQAETVDYILNKAIEKGVTNERGQQTVSAPAMRQAINNIGTEKLDYLLGPDAMKRLTDTLENAKDITQAPGQVKGSPTVVNLKDAAKQAAMDSAKKHMLEGIPWVGKIASGVFDFFEKRKQGAATAQRIDDSLTPSRAAAEDIKAMHDDWATQRNANFRADLLGAAKSSGYIAAEELNRKKLGADIDIALAKHQKAGAVAELSANASQRDRLRAEIEKARKKNAVKAIGTATTVDQAIGAFQESLQED